MEHRAVARLALVLQAIYVGLTFGWRSWLQYRSTGDAGYRLSRAVPPAARTASALITAGAVTGLAGTAVATRSERRRSPARVVGVAGIAAGLVGTYRAQLDMGRSWRIGLDVAERTDLVTDGLFRYARNPIFSFMTLVGLSSAVANPNAATVVGAAMLTAGVEVQVRLVEEPYLREAHGDSYTAYAAKTGRFVPRLGAAPRLR
jgi:protein-S-isoprenylcysteine O-methyltransferase Ste14